MKKHFIKTVSMAIIVIMICMLVACSSSKDKGGTTGPPPDVQTGWPPNSILSQYGLGGMPAPTGGSDFTYSIVNEDGEDILGIKFAGSASVDTVVMNWLISNGWTHTYTVDGINMYIYDTNPDWYAAYSREGTECFLSVVKLTDDDGGGGGGDEDYWEGWPPNNILTQYGLGGMTAPSGATEIYHWYGIEEGLDILAIGFTGNASADSYVIGWLSANGWINLGTEEGVTIFMHGTNNTWMAGYGREGNDCSLAVMKM